MDILYKLPNELIYKVSNYIPYCSICKSTIFIRKCVICNKNHCYDSKFSPCFVKCINKLFLNNPFKNEN